MINIFISFSIIIHYEIHRIFTLLLRPHSTHKFIIKHFFFLLNTIGRMEIFILGVFVSRFAYTMPLLSCFNNKIVSWYLKLMRDVSKGGLLLCTYVILNKNNSFYSCDNHCFFRSKGEVVNFFCLSSSLKFCQTLKNF